MNAIDIHAHYYPQAYLNLIAREGAEQGANYRETPNGAVVDVEGLHAGPLGSAFIELDERLAVMETAEVAVQALSLTQPMVYWAEASLASKLTETFNDSLQDAHERHPEKFVGLATLPMHYPQLAMSEIKRVATLSGVRGLYLATRIRDKELSDRAYFPIYALAEELNFPIFLHPLNVIDATRLGPHFLHNLLGNPFEAAIAAAHLIFGGVLDEFPRLNICLPHAGGAFPSLVGRLHHGWQVRPELQGREKGPRDYLSRFYYDTISHDSAVLKYLVRSVGADRVMLGSDYCFDMGYTRPVEFVTSSETLSRAEQELILGGNASRLLGLGQ